MIETGREEVCPLRAKTGSRSCGGNLLWADAALKPSFKPLRLCPGGECRSAYASESLVLLERLALPPDPETLRKLFRGSEGEPSAAGRPCEAVACLTTVC